MLNDPRGFMAARNLALDSLLRKVSCGLVRAFAEREALNAYLKDRPEGFLLEAGGRTYAMTIDWR